jgi:hypothetical protein
MYVRLKVFDKKINDSHNKPIFFYESDGTHAIKLSIIAVIKRYYGEQIGEKIREILTMEEY